MRMGALPAPRNAWAPVGGGTAQAAVAAALDGCANSSAALNAAFYELGQAEELQAPATVTK